MPLEIFSMGEKAPGKRINQIPSALRSSKQQIHGTHALMTQATQERSHIERSNSHAFHRAVYKQGNEQNLTSERRNKQPHGRTTKQPQAPYTRKESGRKKDQQLSGERKQRKLISERKKELTLTKRNSSSERSHEEVERRRGKQATSKAMAMAMAMAIDGEPRKQRQRPREIAHCATVIVFNLYFDNPTNGW